MKTLEKILIEIASSIIPLTSFVVGSLSRYNYLKYEPIKRYENILTILGLISYYALIGSFLLFSGHNEKIKKFKNYN